MNVELARARVQAAGAVYERATRRTVPMTAWAAYTATRFEDAALDLDLAISVQHRSPIDNVEAVLTPRVVVETIAWA